MKRMVWREGAVARTHVDVHDDGVMVLKWE